MLVSLISVLMKLTELRTPFEKNLFLSLSLNSWASNDPVDAPDGTDANSIIELFSVISTSTVGTPLLSIISLPKTFVIIDIIKLIHF